MAKAKTTKRALLASALSILLCMAMLVGSTYAWFTDSVTSGKNKIVAGNLDVELYVVDGKDETPVDETTNLFMEDALWEPGHVEVVNLKIANLGTLALKYSFGINIEDEKGGTNVAGDPFKLSDYIMFALIEGNNTYETREEAIAAAEKNAVKISALAVDENGVLYPAEKATEENPASRYVTLVVYMPTAVGNEANYKTGTDAPTIDLGVTLLATQATVESDSFGKDYDADAEKFLDPDAQAAADGYAYRDANGNYGKIENLTNLINQFNGQSVTLIQDIKQSSTMSRSDVNLSNTNTTIDLNGHTYTGDMEAMHKEPNDHVNSVLTVKNGTWKGYPGDHTFATNTGKELQNVFFENMTFVNSSTDNKIYGVYLKAGLSDSNFSVKDCTFQSNAKFEKVTGGSGNLTFENATVTGRLWVSGLSASISNTTVEGALKFGESSPKTGADAVSTVTKSIVKGDLYISERTTADKAVVTIKDSTINGGINTAAGKTMLNYDLTLIDTTVTGSLLQAADQYKGMLHIVSGTFGFDPTPYLAEGSSATQNGNTWTVVAG